MIYRDVLARFFQHTKTGDKLREQQAALTINKMEFENG